MVRYAYVGCRTTKERNARGLGIEIYRVEDETGKWEHLYTIGDLINPSYLSFDKEKKFLYTVHGDFSEISSFAVDNITGNLSFLNRVSTEGTNPVFLTPDKTNSYMIVANLQTGTVVSLPRNEDGSLGNVKNKFVIAGKEEDDVSHPHQTMFDNKQTYLLVPAQGRKAGISKTTVLSFDSYNGSFSEKYILQTRELAEARHVAFHPNNRFLYLVNEKDNTVCFHIFDEQTGIMEPKQILSTLPETYTGNGQASGIMVSHDGKYLYVSNRKHDSIAIYEINAETGMLKSIDWVSTLGNTPRFITIDPTGQILYAANEESDTIIPYSIQPDGRLIHTGKIIETGSPVCIIFS